MTNACDPIVKGKGREAGFICRHPSHGTFIVAGVSRRYANLLARRHRTASRARREPA